jgi:Pectate lyase superfamily protein/Periplasmic copper-binding protein (NosD)
MTTTPAKGLTQPLVGGDNNTWGGELNTDLALIDTALGGTLAKSISGNVTLSSTEAQNTGYEFTGTLSGIATITWPSFSGFAAIQNGTTGGFSITCKVSGGTSVTVGIGETVGVWSDGSNFYRLAQVGGGIAPPVFNVKAYGAVGNNAGNDSPAIQAAINAATTNGGGIVFFPPGNYRCNSTLSVSSAQMQLCGSSVELNTGNQDVNLLYINGNRIKVSGLTLAGGALGCTHPVVKVDTAALNCILEDCYIVGGFYCVQNLGSETVIVRNFMGTAYGPAVVYAGASTYLDRVSLDQSWPVSAPTYPGSGFNPWAATTSVASGTIASLGGYYIQCSIAGTTGSTAPSLQNYGVAITDGSAQWFLAAPTTYYGLQIIEGPVDEYNCDHTGPYTAGVAITGTAQDINIVDCTFGGQSINGVLATGNGGGLRISGSQFSNIILGGAIALESAWTGDTDIDGNLIFAAPIGIYHTAGSNTNIRGNRIYGCNIGIFVAAGISEFIIESNQLGNSPNWGPNQNPVEIATGSSDYFIVANNVIHGAANPITNGATGSHTVVSGNL